MFSNLKMKGIADRDQEMQTCLEINTANLCSTGHSLLNLNIYEDHVSVALYVVWRLITLK